MLSICAFGDNKKAPNQSGLFAYSLFLCRLGREPCQKYEMTSKSLFDIFSKTSLEKANS